MNLYREKIPGWDSFTSEEQSGVFPYQYSSTTPANWVDITSIENNDLFGFRASDYVRATFEVDLLFQAKAGSTQEEKFGNCTEAEKKAVASRQLVGLALRLEVFSAQEDQQEFLAYASNSIRSRTNRTEAAKVSMGYLLTTENRQDLFAEVTEKITKYINSEDPDLNNYMQSTSPYVGAGFQAKSYWSQQLQDIYTAIILNGIY